MRQGTTRQDDMKKLNPYAAALAAGVLLGFSAIGVAAGIEKSGMAGENGITCYVLGCYDAAGNEVDKATTASVATNATKAATAATSGRGNIDGIIARYANAYGVPVKLAHAIVRVESNYRVNARGRAGEIGLMQIKPATAKLMGYSGSTKGLYDPDTNIRYAMRYLGRAHELGGKTVCGTILKYNAGHGAKKMNKVSSAYCDKVQEHLSR
jgi:soluble lytic murein transglycosylase-like protein